MEHDKNNELRSESFQNQSQAAENTAADAFVDLFDAQAEQTAAPDDPLEAAAESLSSPSKCSEEGETVLTEYIEASKPTSSEKKKKNRKMDPVSKVILTISVMVFIGSGGFLLYKYIGEPLLEQWQLSAYKDDYQAEETPSANDGLWHGNGENPEEARLANGILASFEPIISLNQDVVGWISVPNTPIDYPVVQTSNNSFYLTHNINKEQNSSGCPFVDYRNIISQNDISKCTIIYGHHRRNGTMFAKLANYDKIDFYRENPVLRFDTIYNRYEWVIFANIRTTASTATGIPFDYMRTDFKDDNDFNTFVADIRKRSYIDTPIDVNADDDILLLSTCSYEKAHWRMVIAARRLRKGETTIDVSSAVRASHPVMP